MQHRGCGTNGVYYLMEVYLNVSILYNISNTPNLNNHPAGMDTALSDITLQTFSTEQQLNWISAIMRQQLAEPYSLFTYTNFLTSWPDLAVMAYHKEKIVGCIIGSYDHVNPKKSYIAMLVVEKEYRRLKVGKKLFDEFYARVKKAGATKIVLETQCINTAALRFYQALGFFKTRRMLNYYMSGNDAFRLKLYIPENQPQDSTQNIQSASQIQQQESHKKKVMHKTSIEASTQKQESKNEVNENEAKK